MAVAQMPPVLPSAQDATGRRAVLVLARAAERPCRPGHTSGNDK